jgi:hypothetical protein
MRAITIEIPPIGHYSHQFFKHVFDFTTPSDYSKTLRVVKAIQGSVYSFAWAVTARQWSSVTERKRQKTDWGETNLAAVQVKTRKVAERNWVQVYRYLHKQDEGTVIHDRGLLKEGKNIRRQDCRLRAKSYFAFELNYHQEFINIETER